MLLLICPSYVPLRIRLRLDSGLICTSILKAFTLLLCFPVNVQLRSKTRTCMSSYGELGNPFFQLLLSGILPILSGSQGSLSWFVWSENWGLSQILAIYAVTVLHTCNWDPPLGQRCRRKETKRRFPLYIFWITSLLFLGSSGQKDASSV